MLSSTIHGLSTSTIPALREQFGENKLPEQRPPTKLELFLQQLKSPLVYVLLAAAAVTFFLGHSEDTLIILVAVAINTILGFYQEAKAGSALQALKNMLAAECVVIRDGKKFRIDTSELVPGDIVVLKAGEKIPADGKALHPNRLFITEAMLTGESVAVEKKTDDALFMGTIVQGGQGYLVVEQIGSLTKMGTIAESLGEKETLTPLQNQLATFSKQLTYIVVGVIILVIIIGLVTGKEFGEIFTTAVALAVGAIPEGLLVALTAVLAIGMQRILKRKGLVKNLVSAETLGGVTVICTDKTGTLTQGDMQVVTIEGDEQQIALQTIIGNDEDNAVALASMARGSERVTNEQAAAIHMLDHIPFSSEQKCVLSLIDGNEAPTLLVNGAPDYLLEWSKMDKKSHEHIKHQLDEYTKKGYRLVGYAKKTMPVGTKKITIEDAHTDLERVGFVGLSDPVRTDVKKALEQTKRAGIKLIVITGDFANTAEHVIEQLGVTLEQDDIKLGAELAEMSDLQLRTYLQGNSHVKLFARTKPEQKMRIVKELKAEGEVVAMMGDGVNDAPALKHADIGIVVNEATDVAKESADLILMDSSFNTIVGAVEEGRGMFDNIRKVILYLMSDAFVEIFAILIAMILGYPLPISAAQILWINLVSDGFPNLALTIDPKRVGLMDEPPRSPKEKLVAPWIKKLIFMVSVIGSLSSLALFIYVLRTTGDETLARSVAFITFGVNSLVYVFSVRTLTSPFWVESPFDNKWLTLAVCVGAMFLVAPFVIPGLGNFLNVVAVGNYWYPAIGTGIVIFFAIELFKWILRHHLTPKSTTVK